MTVHVPDSDYVFFSFVHVVYMCFKFVKLCIIL